jgi:hypothetical protein
MKRWVIGAAAVFCLLWISTPASAAEGWRLEGFAGYYIAEEVDEDISYGVRGMWDTGNGWGVMASYEAFDVNGPGFGESFDFDTSLEHLELSYVASLGKGWELFTGVGAAKMDADHNVQGAVVDLDKTSFSVHSGVAYRADLGDVVYLRPEVRARIYKIGDETVDVTASVALGFHFGGD